MSLEERLAEVLLEGEGRGDTPIELARVVLQFLCDEYDRQLVEAFGVTE